MKRKREKEKILVAVADYPNNAGGVSLMFVHTRNVYYKKSDIDVTVLNFSTKEDYIYDGIKVISLNSYINGNDDYDILLLHAANIRNHYKFLKKYGKRFKKFIFFYHGHEVLRINKVYSKPYSYVSSNKVKMIAQDIYDSFKLYIWRHYLPKVKEKSFFIFVSKWMKDEFLKWVKINERILDNRSSITYNNVDAFFEKESFDDKCGKEYDFVTIRGNLDGSKYSIDIVNRLAKNTPNKKFLIVGKGEFFNHYNKASNVIWLNKTMNHKEIVDTLQKSKFALMPTRTDAQGLMMCEMAAFGIPVITSDIPVCHEVFDGFKNAYFINNEDEDLDLSKFNDGMCKSLKMTKFYEDATVSEEVKTIKKICKQ